MPVCCMCVNVVFACMCLLVHAWNQEGGALPCIVSNCPASVKPLSDQPTSIPACM